MIAALERMGTGKVDGRALFLLSARCVAELPTAIVVGSTYFVSLIVCDARPMSAEDVTNLARTLLKAGCVYFCCWGPDCERVHDIIDETYLEMTGNPIHDDESTIMTTWHSDDSLPEAAWFVLNVAFPDDRFIDKCRAVVATCLGEPSLSDSVREAFAHACARS